MLASISGYTQSTFVSSGGNLSNAKGSISFSIGQVFYSNSSVNNGDVNQGVQQSIELYTLSISDNKALTLKALMYPNPTKGKVVLSLKNIELINLTYQLYDLKGQIINQKKIKKENTIISLEGLSSGIYLLKVNKKENQLKNFKIVKN